MREREVVITGAARTPVGNFGGGLRDATVVELGGVAIGGAIEKAGIDAGQIEVAYVGHARQAGTGPNSGRLAAVAGGVPFKVPVTTVQMACLSGLQAVILAYKDVVLGEARTALAAGMEHMSGIPFLSPTTRWGARMGDAQLLDALYKDGFLDPMSGKIMGVICDGYTTRFGISREDQDAFALKSNLGVARGWDEGFHQIAVVPVTRRGRGKETTVDHDEHYRRDTTMETLGKLRPAFAPDGAVTAGNASALSDAAAALIVMDGELAREAGSKPIARVLSTGVAAMEPEDFGIAPVPAIQKALSAAGLRVQDIDVWELNEAFAVQTLAVIRQLEIDESRVNIYGGAVAMGHPIGMSGTRIVLAAAQALNRKNLRYAVAATCGNGGQGAAMVLERV